MSENSPYINNLQIFKKRFPELVCQIEKLQPPFFDSAAIECFPAKNGELSLLVGQKRVYSSYDPGKEANSLLCNIPSNSELLLFFSFGLGYLPLAVARSYFSNPEKKALPILIVEPDLAFLRLALERIDLEELLSYPNLCFITGEEPKRLFDTLAHYNTPYIYLYKTPLLTQRYPSFFEACQQHLYRYQDYWEVNLNTSKSFSAVWVRNLFKGIKRLEENNTPHCPIKNLFGRFKNEEALILSAGPSLDYYQETIKSFSKRGTIIAVDTALTFCREQAIIPDFIVVSDCQYWNSRHLDFAQVEKSRIITELTAPPSLFQLKPIAFYLYQSRIPLHKAISNFLPPLGELATGGSVSTSAFDFAIRAGFETITLAGLDLSYPENKSHYKGSRFENRTLQFVTKTNSIESFNFDLLHQEIICHFPISPNQWIKSDQRMLLYRDWFVRHIQANPGHYYRLQSNAIEINGFISVKEIPLLQGDAKPKRRKLLQEDHPFTIPPSLIDSFFHLLEEESTFLLQQNFSLTGSEQSIHPAASFLLISEWDSFHDQSLSFEAKEAILQEAVNRLKMKIKSLINKKDS